MTRRTSSSNRRFSRMAGAAVAAATAAGGLLAAAPVAHAEPAPAAMMAHTAYSFTTLDNQSDPTFNQLLGINSHGKISGYFGSGQPGHPNKGYTVKPPYGQSSYVSENFPGSVQTQVTGLNNKGDTVGFWVNGANTNRDFVEWNGVFTSYTNPHTPKVAGSVNQLLGINDSGIAVGFYVDKKGVNHPVKLNQATGHFSPVTARGLQPNSVATGINDRGDISGVTITSSGSFGWLIHSGHLSAFNYPAGSNTMALGVNSHDEVVGSFDDGAGDTHGFTLTNPTGRHSRFTQIDDPNALNAPGAGTVVNGLNNAGDLVGFYTDAAGNVDGMLATP